MNKLIFTTLRGRTAAVLASEKRILQIDFEGEEAAEQIGTIYIGKVRNVVKNLNAAFVEYKPGVNGYYSLNDNRVHTFADGRNSDLPLKSGDEIVVQIARAAVKTKDAVLTGEISLAGRYVSVINRGKRLDDSENNHGKISKNLQNNRETFSKVLETDREVFFHNQEYSDEKNRNEDRNVQKSLGISAKIKNKKWRESFKEQWENAETPNCGVIVRTNAYEADFDSILQEARNLETQLNKICRDASYRTPHSILYRPDSFAVSIVRDLRLNQDTEIVTDLHEIYRELLASGLISSDQTIMKPSRALSLRLYEDSYSLSALYNLESSLDRALGKNVWLKSGGYLVIEPTEAMTVIDVNTGKNIDKKSPEDTYFKTNLEAAAEIAAQIRLRNLSGIIIVDFIDMTDENHNTELLTTFRQYLNTDPVKTTLVDMTALGLVEITRKKIKRPLHERVRTIKSET